MIDHYTLRSAMLADVARRMHQEHASDPPTTRIKHPLVIAAALLTVRRAELLRDEGCVGAVSMSAKPRPLQGDHPVITACRTLLNQHSTAAQFDDYWCMVLSALEDDNLFGWASPPMVFNALALLLTGAVTYKDGYMCVLSSKLYTPTLVDPAGDIQQGFTCTCRWFYASQGLQGPCKHVVAAALHRFANPVLV